VICTAAFVKAAKTVLDAGENNASKAEQLGELMKAAYERAHRAFEQIKLTPDAFAVALARILRSEADPFFALERVSFFASTRALSLQ